ncbi:GMC family oxidoreductase [Thalassotalea euphylliae]|uniref:Choline dehydrogenase n=1 Tax=Thalassotalea euphylliae TaxID=1655234 RepID=A0A3E0UCX9_9GAMM|nr:choline dehydrogenase [Thalassotalea euphylliae]REL34756.1 choline dehydrogenase [Thalassotalea euphylliae]
MDSFDFIIVGGGSAGCVLADKLSADGQFQVCLIEAGPKDSSPFIHVPLGTIELMRSSKYNWLYDTAPEATQNQRQIFNPRGKTLGGSSSVNAMLYVRGQKEDYDAWRDMGNDGWGYDDVLPYFKATQHQERGADDYHGIDGPLNVAESRCKLPVFDKFISSAANAGYPVNNDFNGASQEGVGYYQVTQKDGERCSAAKAFLTPNLDRPNLTVLTEAMVEKVLFEEKIAVGVRIKHKQKWKEIVAHKEVILSAGAFNSPQLLMLSGVGPKAELEKHNIPAVHELAGVGQNLQDHVDIIVLNEYQETDGIAFRPVAMAKLAPSVLKYFTKREGVLTSAAAEAGGFIKTDSTLERPDIQLHFMPFAMDDHGRNLTMLCRYGVAMHVCLLRPKSRGQVTLFGNAPHLHPKIELNMLSDKDDQALMVEGVRRVREIFAQHPLAGELGNEIYPGVSASTNEDILAFLRERANTIYHPVGTCKMGSDEMAVVDKDLKVHGLKSLRVIDASIMPTLISGNTNAPTIMIAAKVADSILAQYQ